MYIYIYMYIYTHIHMHAHIHKYQERRNSLSFMLKKLMLLQLTISRGSELKSFGPRKRIENCLLL